MGMALEAPPASMSDDNCASMINLFLGSSTPLTPPAGGGTPYVPSPAGDGLRTKPDGTIWAQAYPADMSRYHRSAATVCPQTEAVRARVRAIAEQVGISTTALMAIMTVESGGTNVTRNAIRFERHWFLGYSPSLPGRSDLRHHWSAANGNAYTPSNSSAADYSRGSGNRADFDRAYALDKKNAIASTSFGNFQVMGKYTSLSDEPLLKNATLTDAGAAAFLAAFDANPTEIGDKMVVLWFDKVAPGAAAAAQAQDWPAFAKLYNGGLCCAALPADDGGVYHWKLKGAYDSAVEKCSILPPVASN